MSEFDPTTPWASTPVGDADAPPEAPVAGPGGTSGTQGALKRMAGFYVKRDEDLRLLDLLADMSDRTLVNDEGRAIILAGPSGAGKTTLLKHVTRDHPDLAIDAPDGMAPGMVFVQVPPACTVADLGIAIARAAGWPVKDGLKASVAWGAAMRVLFEKKIKFLWLDEVTNITDNLNVREARKIRTHVKMSLVNRRHPMGLVLSGDLSITTFLLADRHVLRRSDVLTLQPVDRRMFKVIELAIKKLAGKAGMATSDDLGGEIVPRLVHAALDQFGTSLEISRTTIMRATRRGRSGGAGPMPVLGLQDFAFSWARAYGVGADQNPFLVPDWAKLDCAAIISRTRPDAEPVAVRRPNGPTRGKVL